MKIKEKADKVLEALAHEFKFFKELTAAPSVDLWKLIGFHTKMDRTFEVTNLTVQVSCFPLTSFFFQKVKKSKLAVYTFCLMGIWACTATRVVGSLTSHKGSS